MRCTCVRAWWSVLPPPPCVVHAPPSWFPEPFTYTNTTTTTTWAPAVAEQPRRQPPAKSRRPA